jgi:hypothetical protein
MKPDDESSVVRLPSPLRCSSRNRSSAGPTWCQCGYAEFHRESIARAQTERCGARAQVWTKRLVRHPLLQVIAGQRCRWAKIRQRMPSNRACPPTAIPHTGMRVESSRGHAQSRARLLPPCRCLMDANTAQSPRRTVSFYVTDECVSRMRFGRRMRLRRFGRAHRAHTDERRATDRRNPSRTLAGDAGTQTRGLER